MLILTVTDLVENRTLRREGSEHDLMQAIRGVYQDTVKGCTSLAEMVRALEDTGHYAVKVETPNHMVGDHNLLPDDYLTHDQGDDPWVREADLPR